MATTMRCPTRSGGGTARGRGGEGVGVAAAASAAVDGGVGGRAARFEWKGRAGQRRQKLVLLSALLLPLGVEARRRWRGVEEMMMRLLLLLARPEPLLMCRMLAGWP